MHVDESKIKLMVDFVHDCACKCYKQSLKGIDNLLQVNSIIADLLQPSLSAEDLAK